MKLKSPNGALKTFMASCKERVLRLVLPCAGRVFDAWYLLVALLWQRLFARWCFTPERFRQEFDSAGLAKRAPLVHPTLPCGRRVGLWYSIPRTPDFPSPPGTVELRLRRKGAAAAELTLEQEAADYIGHISADAPADGSYEATLVVDGVALPPVTVCTALRGNNAFSFLAYSCFAPFPSRGDNTPLARTVHGLNLLAQRSTWPGDAEPQAPAFALALGDQVYVDNGTQALIPPKRALLFGFRSEHPRYPEGATTAQIEGYFRELYDAFVRIPPYEQSLRAIPHAMMWDDHDIRDGWGSQGDETRAGWSAYLAAARAQFLAHQHARNPGAAGQSSAGQTEHHFEFEWGAATRFFVMDLRSARQTSTKDGQVVSAAQLAAIRSWLSAGVETDRPKLYVLATALPLTHGAEDTSSLTWRAWFRADDRRDNWWSDESRTQRDALLELLHEHFRDNEKDRLLVLSGDVHFGEILSLTLEDEKGPRVFGHEVISSGLAQSSFHASNHRKQTQGSTELIPGLTSTSAGSRLFAPHFAEIFVAEGSNDEAPGVKVLFCPSADPQRKHLVNPLPRLRELVRDKGLPLTVGREVQPVRLPSFDRFMLAGRNPASWHDDAAGWSLGGACWDPEVCSTQVDTPGSASSS